MRKIIASTYVSLDGVIEDPQNWTMEYFSEDAGAYAFGLLQTCDALLMGRRTYDGFAASWPTMEEQTGEFGVKMNTMPKYVVSDTLETADWTNSTIIRRDQALDEVRALKEQPGGDILMYGFGPLAYDLLRDGLLDEARFWIHPVFVGGESLSNQFTIDKAAPKLELADTQTLSSGVVIVSYRPAAKAT
ncbi:dihydrofolate reductase family protein [Plantactinospora sp. GCM10030261]|uniref:dihydrofolate reductase family protein n=1 Tax=Plantactinospora sp. GCM10030261 TaxID=3273420 RepID=UPI00361A3703